ncbi:5ffba10d-8892-4564-ab5b-a0dda35c9f7f [Sclerotinia trifoliorum]|uniref:5ffba10d-8892-4564-ab5b-a0dda35c9f7f n=1 Tax=Sclerotinia trifoliorum TaxID=28548 RepID=A0A8H2VLP2_9HELO|nr:5ffba10d-8892-4564-ab5b-a0dda35c9f7f [Sclerotinia trifoliorum]
METPDTTWLSISTSTFYYISLPITFIFRWLLAILSTALAPLLHLGNSLISASLLPLKVLAKFEALIIFLGSAIFIGFITGSVLRISSNVLASLLKLTSNPEDTGHSLVSIRATEEQKKQETKPDLLKWKVDPSVEKRYSEWLEKDGGRKKDEHGLLAQTIIEEDDDSDDGF